MSKPLYDRHRRPAQQQRRIAAGDRGAARGRAETMKACLRVPRRLVIGLTTLAGLMLGPAGDALACSRLSPGSPCQSAFQVDAVFAGTVREYFCG